ncbi:putative NADH dehydrogenase [ubiquinone] 1 alpha subcomplex subunit 5, mitochondrial [Capsicum annuum]|nr:putative NADH dehydrogenase [ubiquinone] 1 alpha subcomplex subunit 5, mitochondrial [Capsicum annuum]
MFLRRVARPLMMTAKLKQPTGIVGLHVVPNAREVLIDLYTKTLEEIKAVPEDAEYCKDVERFTRRGLSVCQEEEDFEMIEKRLGCGQAQHELNLVGKMNGKIYGDYMQSKCNLQRNVCQCQKYSMMLRASYSTEAGTVESSVTESVKELYDKMLKSVLDQRSAPPNAWLWSLIQSCANREDANLLFDILKRLRIFRLSNLRIHENFNCALCQEITKACVRVGAIDLGKKVLWKHNVYGLTPNIGSAHHLLLFSKQHNDVKLLVEIMNLVKKNDLILQPGTADIVFSICSQTDNWDLICKYGKRFVKAGVKLRKTSLDTWMEFASKMGDVDCLWKIEKIRSETMKEHSLESGLSCAKAFLIDHKPEDAAAVIQLLNQTVPDSRRQKFMVELQKLVEEWPLEVIKRQKDERRKELAATLHVDLPTMLSALSNMGLRLNVNVEDLTREGVFA